jgi:protocatechuate 3,4-dioxygenase beta subunit
MEDEDYDNGGNPGPGGRLLTRKEIFLLFGGVGLAGLTTLIGCGGSNASQLATAFGSDGTTAFPSPTASATPIPEASASPVATVTATPSATAGSCVLIPSETQGPYPLLAVLSNSSMDRSDITEGKIDVPLTLKIDLKNASDGACGVIRNAAVYVWHCDKDGAYSGYDHQGDSTVGQTFLSGIPVSDGDGSVTFQAILPGWSAGRITHVHSQVYRNVIATATSQNTFPQGITRTVYASSL